MAMGNNTNGSTTLTTYSITFRYVNIHIPLYLSGGDTLRKIKAGIVAHHPELTELFATKALRVILPGVIITDEANEEGLDYSFSDEILRDMEKEGCVHVLLGQQINTYVQINMDQIMLRGCADNAQSYKDVIDYLSRTAEEFLELMESGAITPKTILKSGTQNFMDYIKEMGFPYLETGKLLADVIVDEILAKGKYQLLSRFTVKLDRKIEESLADAIMSRGHLAYSGEV